VLLLQTARQAATGARSPAERRTPKIGSFSIQVNAKPPPSDGQAPIRLRVAMPVVAMPVVAMPLVAMPVVAMPVVAMPRVA
jgi:hypothetical protein